MLPLDLHVLSLWLAFILSQDQTLRCNLYLYLFPCGIDFLPFTGRLFQDFLFLRPAGPKAAGRLACIMSLYSFSLAFDHLVSVGKRMQRYGAFTIPTKHFGKYFLDFFLHFPSKRCATSVWTRKFFFVPRRHFPQGRRKRQGEAATSRDCLPLRMTCAVVRRAGAPRRVCIGMSWPCP